MTTAVEPNQNELFKKELNEKCGVLGIIGPQTVSMGHLLYFGLYALQHRGQESCGMAVFHDDQLNLHKSLGLVSQVFTEDGLKKMRGQVGVGHTRYATTGDSSQENSQPVVSRSMWGSLVLAHNGNLINLSKLREAFNLEYGDAFGANSDSHLMVRCMAQVLGRQRGQTEQPNLLAAAQTVLERCEGAFSVVVAMGDQLLAARDRYGIRPLCLGQIAAKEGKPALLVAASETCALDIVGAEYLRDVAPGELVLLNPDGTMESIFLTSEGETPQPERFCAFEYVYFARPDSRMHQQTVYDARLAMGRLLAQTHPVEADLVISVPDSGTAAAVGYSQASGIAYSEGLMKNRYVGRTFIHPTPELREQGIRLKLNPLVSIIRGKRVVVVDDSIVRGVTSQRLVQLLRDAGVAEVHLRISSPPVKHPCFYGIDMSTEEELLANHYADVEGIRAWLGADSLAYLSVADLQTAIGPQVTPCMACFTNQYPAGKPAAGERLTIGCSG